MFLKDVIFLLRLRKISDYHVTFANLREKFNR